MKKIVKFTVQASDGVQGRWIKVNGDGVDLINDQGKIDLEAGKHKSHKLSWSFTGNSGATLSILIKVENSNGEIEKTEETLLSKIPEAGSSGGGAKTFTV